MKMICNKAGTCGRASTCILGVAHEMADACSGGNCTAGHGAVFCVPVKPKRKAVTVWVVTRHHASGKSAIGGHRVLDSREIARKVARQWRTEKWQVRGPVKVVLS